MELVAIVVIAGVLVAIVAPGWLAFANSRILTAAQDQAYQAFKQTQREAIRRRIRAEVSFRQFNNRVEWSTHPVNSLPQNWQPLESGAKIDPAYTNLHLSGGIYRMQFDEQGNANGQLGKLTFAGTNGGNARRCVFVSTLIGTLRKDSDQGCRQ